MTINLGRAAVGAVLVQALLAGTSLAAGPCPALTVADTHGLVGQFPQQFELAELEQAAGCTLTFSENPEIAALNARIGDNPATLPPVAARLPAEPLVVLPYQEIGTYGGTLHGLSNATEAGTSDVLSLRHVNLVRYADDLQTVVPNVAKSWQWNDDYTVLTVSLREGHKWSDGAPFTADDIVFWYNDLILNDNIYPRTPARWLFDGRPMRVDALDATTVQFTLPVPSPGLLNRFAVDYGQPFQPKHFLSRFHIAYNPDADALAAAQGFEGWGELLNNYYGGSDWKDVPSPLIDQSDDVVVPTLESHVLVAESSGGRTVVANPYFHMVDTAGNQLPYISVIDERYVPDKEVRNLKITSGEVDYKVQATYIEDFPLYKENEGNGDYTVHLAPSLGETVFYAWNTTHKDEGLRAIFNDVRFRQAMSLALDRDEINDVVYLGQGQAEQAVPADPRTVTFVTLEHRKAFTEFDPERADQLLTEAGLIDHDRDGLRERPDGSPLVILLQYSNQGSPVRLHELASDNWRQVGVRVDIKEVTSDEYRANASTNDLDMTAWRNDNVSAPTISQNTWRLVPTAGDYFNPDTGWEWANWFASNGTEGIEPPEDVKRLHALAEAFTRHPIGSDESNRIGTEITDIHIANLWKVGTVGGVKAPIIQHNRIGNFQPFKAVTYDYYWSYPYRAQQWFLKR